MLESATVAAIHLTAFGLPGPRIHAEEPPLPTGVVLQDPPHRPVQNTMQCSSW